MTWLTLAVLGLRIVAALLTGRKDDAEKHAQKIVDHLSGERDRANAEAAAAEVKLVVEEARVDAEKRDAIADSQRGGPW
jgi:hypothetical protein